MKANCGGSVAYALSDRLKGLGSNSSNNKLSTWARPLTLSLIVSFLVSAKGTNVLDYVLLFCEIVFCEIVLYFY